MPVGTSQNWPAQQEWLRRYFVFEPATYGLEGLANLRKTMLNNDSQCPDLGVREKTGGHGVGWDLMLGSWYLQVFVGKTDKLIK